MSEIAWQDPPPAALKNRGRGSTQAFVAELQARPGQWALYHHAMASSSIGMYRLKFPAVEWVTRRRDDGKVDLYGRWVGES